MVTVQAELKAVKAEYEALKAWKVAAEDADHMRRVQDVVDLRIKNGVLDPRTFKPLSILSRSYRTMRSMR